MSLFISRNREKLLNAMLYFVANTNYCNTLKLLKLIYLLDFEHFRQTGETVTGLKYEAWKQGPVARQLWNEMRKPPADLGRYFSIATQRDELTDVPTRRDFTARKNFDSKIFTRRELKILERLALFFKDLPANQMSQYTHGPRMPWKRVYDDRETKTIPHELALDAPALLNEIPTISKEELAYREEALKEVRAHTD
jgi:uncharacterized phage-associated protein